jgi:hypothetical protein
MPTAASTLASGRLLAEVISGGCSSIPKRAVPRVHACARARWCSCQSSFAHSRESMLAICCPSTPIQSVLLPTTQRPCCCLLFWFVAHAIWLRAMRVRVGTTLSLGSVPYLCCGVCEWIPQVWSKVAVVCSTTRPTSRRVRCSVLLLLRRCSVARV